MELTIRETGDLNPASRFHGRAREQNTVLHAGGLAKCVPATYEMHPYKILEVYEKTD